MGKSHNTNAAASEQEVNPQPQPYTTIGHKISRAVVIAGAVLLVSASALLGAYFGYQIGSHYHWMLGGVFALAALGGEAVKPFALSASLSALSSFKTMGRGVLLMMLALVCIAYNVTAELSLTAGTRGDLAAKRSAQHQKAVVALFDRNDT